MKLTRLFFSALLAFSAVPFLASTQPVVSNVAFVQQPDGAGSTRIRVTYDLASPNGNATVSLRYSTDSGTSFSTAPTITGAVGAGVVPGTGKTIDWAVATDLPGLMVANTFVVRVVAIDSSELLEFVSVPGVTFTMGRSSAAQDTFGGSNELPNHQVTLSAYDLGKFEVTNGQFATVMNWALAQGYLANDNAGTAYAGASLVRLRAPSHSGTRAELFGTVSPSRIEWTGAAFTPGSVDLQSMSDYPMVDVSWYGAVAFCNFLAEMEGKPLAYNTNPWALVDADPNDPGLQYVASYRLPTEAEWECAAAWDGAKHWVYSHMSDTLAVNTRVNYSGVNPMGWSGTSGLSPVGWFNGTNVSPNGSVATVDSPSPVGAYDMSGNVWEWCHNGYESYTASAKVKPQGPSSNVNRVVRGGGHRSIGHDCRTAKRDSHYLTTRYNFIGFRVAAVR